METTKRECVKYIESTTEMLRLLISRGLLQTTVYITSARRLKSVTFTHSNGPRYLSRYSDSLPAGPSGDRIPVGSRFSAHVQTGPGAYPASCTMGTGSFLGVKRPGSGADHPPATKCRGHERVGLYLYSPSGLQWPGIGRTLHTARKFDLRKCIDLHK